MNVTFIAPPLCKCAAPKQWHELQRQISKLSLPIVVNYGSSQVDPWKSLIQGALGKGVVYHEPYIVFENWQPEPLTPDFVERMVKMLGKVSP